MLSFRFCSKQLSSNCLCTGRDVSIFVLLIVVAIDNDGGDFFLNINEHFIYEYIYKEKKKDLD